MDYEKAMRKYKWQGPDNNFSYNHRFITVDPTTPGFRVTPGAHTGNRHSVEYYSKPVSMSALNGYE
jgi:hypothetical protein